MLRRGGFCCACGGIIRETHSTIVYAVDFTATPTVVGLFQFHSRALHPLRNTTSGEEAGAAPTHCVDQYPKIEKGEAFNRTLRELNTQLTHSALTSALKFPNLNGGALTGDSKEMLQLLARLNPSWSWSADVVDTEIDILGFYDRATLVPRMTPAQLNNRLAAETLVKTEFQRFIADHKSLNGPNILPASLMIPKTSEEVVVQDYLEIKLFNSTTDPQQLYKLPLELFKYGIPTEHCLTLYQRHGSI